jgi:uncharacterized membrane protein YphA (DoxX/SURF4 family)
VNEQPGLLRRVDETGWPSLVARLVLAAMFIYTGFNKAVEPYDFLKMLREYHLFAPESFWLMNLVAITLPWLEIFCGVLLLGGIALRGTALVLVGMLVPFTIVVTLRALSIQKAEEIAFCAIKFDCGCGTGAVNICKKLVENTGLILLSLILFWSQTTWAFGNLWSPRKASVG